VHGSLFMRSRYNIRRSMRGVVQRTRNPVPRKKIARRKRCRHIDGISSIRSMRRRRDARELPCRMRPIYVRFRGGQHV
jgi:hypothetical protein